MHEGPLHRQCGGRRCGPPRSRELFIDVLGLPLEGEGDGYYSSGSVAGSHHFGIWPLSQAAEARFATAEWPADRVIPQASIEFEVEDVDAVAAAGDEQRQAGFELMHPPRTEPWGQTVSRLLTDDGLIIGISYAPAFHSGPPEFFGPIPDGGDFSISPKAEAPEPRTVSGQSVSGTSRASPVMSIIWRTAGDPQSIRRRPPSSRERPAAHMTIRMPVRSMKFTSVRSRTIDGEGLSSAWSSECSSPGALAMSSSPDARSTREVRSPQIRIVRDPCFSTEIAFANPQPSSRFHLKGARPPSQPTGFKRPDGVLLAPVPAQHLGQARDAHISSPWRMALARVGQRDQC